METTVTALEMRKKFGGILDRVVHKGDHITIMRGNRPLATLIPAQEHKERCFSQNRAQRIQEVFAKIDRWQKKNAAKLRKGPKIDSTELIRKMRDSRWSSSTPR